MNICWKMEAYLNDWPTMELFTSKSKAIEYAQWFILNEFDDVIEVRTNVLDKSTATVWGRIELIVVREGQEEWEFESVRITQTPIR